MSRYTRWFRDGNIKATNGSTEITGSGTYWESAGLNPGDMLEVNNSGLFYEIASINSDTSITLARAYQGATLTGAAYAIVRNFTATMPSKIAAQTSELITDFRKYVESDMERLTGRSAYEIAKMHGFTGTEAEWLESLKGHATEIAAINSSLSEINTKLGRIYTNRAAAHNSVYRGKNLGSTITSAQWEAISKGTFEDMYIGDSWTFNMDGKSIIGTIMGFCCHMLADGKVILLLNQLGSSVINDTADTSTGLVNSKLFTQTFPELLQKITTAIPDEHILEFNDITADACSSGNISHTVGTPSKLFLPSTRNLGWLDQSKLVYHTMGKARWPFSLFNQKLSLGRSWLAHVSTYNHWYATTYYYPHGTSVAANEVHTVSPYIMLV